VPDRLVGRRTPAGRPLTARDRDADLAGFFGPASLTWRLDREAFLLLGAGPRALLLQIAHPDVAAGVADHSSFRADPWARLAGTLRSYLRIVYGTTADARAEVRRLNVLHRTVRGTRANGLAYDAGDPELRLWVHATLVDSTLATAAAWLGPVHDGARARARIYEESIPVGRAFGIPLAILPRGIDEFDDYVGSMLGPGGPARPGPLARELATVILNPPPGPAIRTLTTAAEGILPSPIRRAITTAGNRIPAPTVAWLLWPSIGLLPVEVRTAYGLPWDPFRRAVSGWLVATWRGWNAVLPEAVRQMSQARAADRRVSGRGAGSAP
jgi:uncharacterized protein (DUF2236 family)